MDYSNDDDDDDDDGDGDDDDSDDDDDDMMMLLLLLFFFFFFFLSPEGRPGMSDVSCLESQGCHLIPFCYYNNNKNISRTLNPSVSNQPEAQSTFQLKLSKLHIQLKPSKQKCSDVKRKNNNNNRKTSKQTNKSRELAGKGARSKHQVNN